MNLIKHKTTQDPAGILTISVTWRHKFGHMNLRGNQIALILMSLWCMMGRLSKRPNLVQLNDNNQTCQVKSQWAAPKSDYQLVTLNPLCPPNCASNQRKSPHLSPNSS